MIATLLPLIPLLAPIVPQIASWIGGDDAEDVARQVTSVVQSVAGSTDPAVVAATIADPQRGEQLILELARISAERAKAADEARIEELAARLRDTADARAQTVSLAQARHPLAYGAPVVSVIVLTAFGAACWLVLTKALPDGSQDIALYTMGALQTMAGSVVSYWVGSSAGSAAKDQRLAAASPPAGAVRSILGR